MTLELSEHARDQIVNSITEIRDMSQAVYALFGLLEGIPTNELLNHFETRPPKTDMLRVEENLQVLLTAIRNDYHEDRS